MPCNGETRGSIGPCRAPLYLDIEFGPVDAGQVGDGPIEIEAEAVAVPPIDDELIEVDAAPELGTVDLAPREADEGSGEDESVPAAITALAPSADAVDADPETSGASVPATVTNPSGSTSPSVVGGTGRRSGIRALPSTGSGVGDEGAGLPLALVGLGLVVMAGAGDRLGRPRA